MIRVVAHETWLRALDTVVYHQHIGNGYWLADIELHHVVR